MIRNYLVNSYSCNCQTRKVAATLTKFEGHEQAPRCRCVVEVNTASGLHCDILETLISKLRTVDDRVREASYRMACSSIEFILPSAVGTDSFKAKLSRELS